MSERRAILEKDVAQADPSTLSGKADMTDGMGDGIPAYFHIQTASSIQTGAHVQNNDLLLVSLSPCKESESMQGFHAGVL